MQRARTPNRHCGLSQRISLHSASNPAGPRPAYCHFACARFQLVLAAVAPVARGRGEVSRFRGTSRATLLRARPRRETPPRIRAAASRRQWGGLLVGGTGPRDVWHDVTSSWGERLPLPSYISLSGPCLSGDYGSKRCRERLARPGWNMALVCHLICV